MDYINWPEFLELTDYAKKKKRRHSFNEDQLERAFFSGMWNEQQVTQENKEEIKKEFKRSFFQRNEWLFTVILVILAVIFVAAFFLMGGLEVLEGLTVG